SISNINVKLDANPVGNVTLIIQDLAGKTVLTETTNALETSLNISKLSAGTYILQARSNAKDVLGQFRIVKQ
ncbi:MAG: T9SS type A sorting domain-containing protein, partial [Flavobacteriales bacterium]